MRSMMKQGLVAAAMVVMSAFGANAAIHSIAGSPGPHATNQWITRTLSVAVGGAATLSFDLLGYLSLDGDNFYQDNFRLRVNGTTIVRATFDLGGGGADQVFLAPAGATFDNTGPHNGLPDWGGGLVHITVPVTLVAGLNTFRFGYRSLDGLFHAGFQGLCDEAWGFDNVTVTVSAVPEPATWAMMLIGFAGLAFAARRRAAAR